MKTLILGDKGTGKTTFIVSHIIPKLNNNYKVFDFLDEYIERIKDPERIIKINGFMGKKLHEMVEQRICCSDNDTCFILENSSVLLKPISLSKDEPSWLWDKAYNKNIIVVSESLQSIIDRGIANFFDEIYYFDTRDNDDTMNIFLTVQKSAGVILNKLSKN